MNGANLIRVLLIEDDEDDYILTEALFSEIKGQRYTLDWARTYDEGLRTIQLNQHDVCLVDYRLGAKTGIELIEAAMAAGCQIPIILLTGQGEHEVDLAAMKAGAADYLVKGRLDAQQLERSVRYASERRRAAAHAAFEQARIAAFGAEVGLALTRSAALDAILSDCAGAMAQYLNASLSQLWIYNSKLSKLQLRASAGWLARQNASNPELRSLLPAKLDLQHSQPLVLPVPALAQLDESQRSQMVSWAACPLMLEDRLVGYMSMYADRLLNETILQEMGSVASGVALCIQRKLAEEALDASENRYRSVVESIKEVIFQINEFGQWMFLNPAWTATTGFAVEEALGTFFLDYLHHDDREQGRCVFLQLINRKLDYCRYETRLLTKEGKIRWVEFYMQLTLESDGTVLGASGSLNDITDRKRAEAEVQKLAAFPRVNPNPVLEFNAEGELTYANEAALELARSLGKEDLAGIMPADVKLIVQACFANGSKRLREEVHLGDRTLTWSFFPIAANRVVHCYGADITEMLNLEAQFRHAQKLESVGQMAAGIAHDFNNILTVIQGYADCLQARGGGGNSHSVPLQRIAEASRRAATLTRQLLMFSRKQIIQTHAMDLNVVLRNLTNMLSRLLGEDIALVTDYLPSLPQIEADAGMIEQVVMNLAVNARDAMPKGGQLKISTCVRDMDAVGARQRPEARPGRFVCLTVTDSGCGMDSQTLNRIFEPFFSTKEVGKGTGLGLATVYGIVRQHQGWIEVTSQVGVGTTFNILLPALAVSTGITDEDVATPLSVRGGRETVLIVEDEPVLRELVREILGQYEYRLLEAGSGVEALKVWDEHPGSVDLLLTDMIMPEGMTGRDLAEQLRQRKPDLKVIYTSGYSPKIVGQGLVESGALFLQKPYDPRRLAQIVRECLDTSPAPECEPTAAAV